MLYEDEIDYFMFLLQQDLRVLFMHMIALYFALMQVP